MKVIPLINTYNLDLSILHQKSDLESPVEKIIELKLEGGCNSSFYTYILGNHSVS